MPGEHLFCADWSGTEKVTIMMSLFDEEQIMKSFIRSERHDADVETAKHFLKKIINCIHIKNSVKAHGTVNYEPCVFCAKKEEQWANPTWITTFKPLP